MIIGNHTKQSNDVLDYDFDYAEWLADTGTDQIESAVVTSEPAGLSVLSSVVNSPRVKMWLSGGENGATYKITVKATTTDGRVKEDEFKLKIKDI